MLKNTIFLIFHLRVNLNKFGFVFAEFRPHGRITFAHYCFQRFPMKDMDLTSAVFDCSHFLQ